MSASPAGPSRARERYLTRSGFRMVAGVDEVGRGPLAGPVVAAAVILPPRWDVQGVNDSKRLDHNRRRTLAAAIKQKAVTWAVGSASPQEIDRINIHRASLLAMRRAVNALAPSPDFLLVDGRFVLELDLPQEAVVGGDASCTAVAAASILAKVERDAVMQAMHLIWPQYKFAANKGYGTADHRQALIDHGPCPLHRRSYAPVAQRQLDLGLG
ncbi:MAG: ribonuclease HII [Proteobacteria bacterium]|nr:ribonuclease HII [Pseudomonadota bacterium]MBU1450053.1 ribonuclease HII [Pseudomonadota bacterium]MBU2467249.1 ribonuclease HII [Pseudomonadota bacterium]MBU2519049.1 ribonuclease HII [Pseudomonadota bacterium]